MPEYAQALSALDDLDNFLNAYEEMHSQYENMEGPKAAPSKKAAAKFPFKKNTRGSATLTSTPPSTSKLTAPTDSTGSHASSAEGDTVAKHAQEGKVTTYASLMDSLM